MDPQTMALLNAMMQMQQRNQNSGMQQEVDAADALGPDGQAQLAALGSMPDRMALGRDVYGQQADQYAGDMAEAQKLQAQRFGNSGSAIGNVLGGLGDIASTIRGGLLEKRTREGQANALKSYQDAQGGLLDTQDNTRTRFGNARLEAMRRLLGNSQPGQRPAAAGPLLPGGAFYSPQ